MKLSSNKAKYKKKKEILDKLFSFQRFGIKPGLGRTKKLISFLDNPQEHFHSIHVAGTNGKGSVCSMLASILMEQGYRTGLYTSPHLVSFNERISINGKLIEDEDLIGLSEEILPYAEHIGATFFEITTAMAFKYFAEQKTEVAVIETGMGGRYDSTNVLLPMLSIITKVDYDHSEYLGNTLAKIAFEKAGIIKKSKPVVVSKNDNVVYDVIRKKAKSKASELILADESMKCGEFTYKDDLTMDIKMESDVCHYPSVNVALAGSHQIDNIKTVWSAIKIVNRSMEVTKKSVCDGFKNIIKNTNFHCRTELINKEYPIVLDVAHNPDSVRQTVGTIIDCGLEKKKWNIVFALMSDKDAVNVLKYLKLICYKLIITKPEITRAAEPEDLKLKAIESGIKNIVITKNVRESAELVLSKPQPILVIGSFYLLGEFLPFLNKTIKE
ncbi:MAG: bifunctional folylpolyglutamate synthase/dihydrofolate synthase [Bacteroidetes bacterium]|nr:MAG: bifunctional folylpolyglutamate synthase/dihydrofolate synthase [Bacteroidota bacterium]